MDYDLVVIGGGSAGVRLSRTAAALGARTALVEERYLGGTCVNVGCVPKKLFTYGAHYAEDFADAAGYGWTVGATSFDWPTLIRNKNAEIERLNGVYARLLDRVGVEVFEGRGTIDGPNTVVVGERRLSTERIAIATGGWPWTPDFPGREHAISSNEVFYLDALPERIAIAGGGYVATEFASIFNGFGSRVDLLYRGPLFLRGFDDDARRLVADEMQKKGIRLHFEQSITRIDRTGDDYVVHRTTGEPLHVDCVLSALGRRPLTAGIGLEDAGVTLDERGAVVVDDAFRSSVPSIYALGDAIDRVQLTPVALAEATILARNLFGGGAGTMDYRCIPTAVFCHPTLGAVGLTEAEARDRHRNTRVYSASFRPMKHTMSGRASKTLVKLVVDEDTDRVVGCHMVGDAADEIVQMAAIALQCGATKAQFDATIGIHPTTAEEFVTLRG